jgi:hypothetical protein
MELGFALGLSMSGIPELDALLPLIATEDVIGIGARSPDARRRPPAAGSATRAP